MSSLRTEHRDARVWLIVALVLIFLLIWIPFGDLLLYPLRLFTTFIHEACHALAAILSGGRVDGFTLGWDTSGLARTSGGYRPLISTAGYLGTTVIGSLLLFAARRASWAKGVLTVMGLMTFAMTIAFSGYGNKWVSLVGTLVAACCAWGGLSSRSRPIKRSLKIAGFAVVLALGLYLSFYGGLLSSTVGLSMGAVLLGLGLLTPASSAQPVLIFLAVHTLFNALSDARHLLWMSVNSGRHSDAVNMARYTGWPAWIWALVWIGTVLLITALAVYLFWRDEEKRRRLIWPASR